MCAWLGAGLEVRGRVGERSGLGLYQSCENSQSVRRVSVFWLRQCEWWWAKEWVEGLGQGLGV